MEIDENGESSVNGLYAAGDPVGNFRADIGGAATFGWIAGGSAAERARNTASGADVSQSPIVKDRTDMYSTFMGRENGAPWKEANLALQQIMRDYAGVEVRSATLLSAGLKYLGDLKRKVLASMQADDAHTLMRCVEVLDLMVCGETIMRTALERKETRAMHKRSDFTFTNPLLGEKFLTICQENGEPVLAWRDKR